MGLTNEQVYIDTFEAHEFSQIGTALWKYEMSVIDLT